MLMLMSNLHVMFDAFSVSPWLDNLSRDMIRSGGLADYVTKGVRGVTSNPSIFEHAFASTTTYDEAMSQLRSTGQSTESAYWTMAVEDIQSACDILRPVYDQSAAEDGYVSLEVSPEFAHDCDKTVAQAIELWQRVDRPNLMIKIPATVECLPAITICISKGINVNVTLIFSLNRYLQVVNAYMSGLERCNHPKLVRSVASFFISRVDTEVDAQLESKSRHDLKGLAAIAQARAAYGIFLESFNDLAERWSHLKDRGANIQRPLWASTSTKDPNYSDLKYVNGLLTLDSVNTLPDGTITAIIEHGQFQDIKPVNVEDIEQAHEQLAILAEAGIDMKQVAEKLEMEGVEKFEKAFQTMLAALDKKQ